jgi:hypothetical protein
MSKFLIMSLLFGVSTVVHGQHPQVDIERAHWTISHVEVSVGEPEANTTKYHLGFTRSEKAQIWTSISYEDLLVACKMLKVSKTSELVGLTLTAEENKTPDATLKRQIFFAKNPTYKAPAPETLVKKAEKSLAGMQCPDFSNEDPDVVNDAFVRSYHLGFPNVNWQDPEKTADFQWSPVWLDAFLQAIRSQGQGKAQIRVINRPRFFGDPIRIIFAQKDKRLLVVMDPAPDGPSFICDSV